MNEINKGIRLVNWIVDMMIITIMSAVIFMILKMITEIKINPKIILYIIWILYYYLFESYDGQTLGKKLTNTIVVDMKKNQPSRKRIFIRTILRLNPFDAFSYLFGQEQGGHDTLSKTRLICKSKAS